MTKGKHDLVHNRSGTHLQLGAFHSPRPCALSLCPSPSRWLQHQGADSDSRSTKVLEGVGGIGEPVIAPWPASGDEVPASLRVAGYHPPPSSP